MVNVNRGANGNDSSTNGSSGSQGQSPDFPPVHYLHELPQADEERLEKIFNKLDRDGNGRIDIHDLSSALKEFGLSHQYAEVRVAPLSLSPRHKPYLMLFQPSNLLVTGLVIPSSSLCLNCLYSYWICGIWKGN